MWFQPGIVFIVLMYVCCARKFWFARILIRYQRHCVRGLYYRSWSLTVLLTWCVPTSTATWCACRSPGVSSARVWAQSRRLMRSGRAGLCCWSSSSSPPTSKPYPVWVHVVVVALVLWVYCTYVRRYMNRGGKSDFPGKTIRADDTETSV